MKNITKKLEIFVSKIENHIFVVKLMSKVSHLHNVNMEKTEVFLNFVVKKYRKLVKFVYGKERVREFFVNNIECFSHNHSVIVNMIENGDVNTNWEKYLICKNNISATLKANRKFASKITGSEVKSYLNDYITKQRFVKKYELAI
jgi:hypothetical protein